MTVMNSKKTSWIRTLIGILILLIFLFPVYWMINISLQSAGSAVVSPIYPKSPTFSGYLAAIRAQSGPILTSLIVAIGATLVSLIIATPAAYALARYRIKGSSTILLVILLSQMIPTIVVANALYSAYSDLGLLNTVIGLILADASLGIPFSILILQTFMKNIPQAIIEASWIDGAGAFRTFVSIALPMSRNAIVTAGLFSFLFAWGDFLFALTLTTSEEVRPITLSLYTYVGAYVQDWGMVMATAVLASLPAIVLLVVAQRFVSAGVAAGSVK